MLFEIFLILFLSIGTECSLVVDSHSQTGLYLSDYCPKMEYCPEGAHVMCMYYNPRSNFGARCRDAQNISISPELANKFLDVSNAVRSKIARGAEKGKNGESFPPGYGIFRLKWDAELATFAQVLANQCMLRHDLCRASKKFPDPGQTIGLVRFSGPDWIPVSKSKKFDKPGLTHEKLLYASEQALRSWYGQKSSVTVQMLKTYPNWTIDPNQQGGRIYLEMIYGPATHMGCGIVAFSEYAYYDNNADLNYNSVQIICNYSARPRNGGAVFNMVPPSDTGTTFNKCGCPAGSIEDNDCLCNEVPPNEPEKPMTIVRKSQSCPNGDCDPTVVLLPIFTVEDAPPDHLIPTNSYANSSANVRREGAPEPDSFEELIDNNISLNKRKSFQDIKIRNTKTQSHQRLIGQKPRSSTHKQVSIRHRHFDRKNNIKTNFDQIDRRRFRQNHQNSRKPSLFAKTPRFALPGLQFMETKKVVVPRKDFSAGKKLASQLYGQKNTNLPKNNNKPYVKDVKSVETPNLIHQDIHHDYVHFDEILTTDTVLNTAEQKVMNHKNHMSDFNNQNQTPELDKHIVKAVTAENDNKLMDLLDTLEREVKHIELHDKDKQIFDAKIKKIYGKIVGNSADTLSRTKTTTPSKDISVELNEHFKDLKASKEHNVYTNNNNNDNFVDDDDKVHILEPPHDKPKQTKLPELKKHLRDTTNIDSDNFDKYMKHEIDDMDLGDLPSIMSKNYKAKSKYDKRDLNRKSRMQHSKNSVIHRNNNDLDSIELKDRYDAYAERKLYKTDNLDNKRNDNDKSIYRNNASSRRYRNKNYGNDVWAEDIMSTERRKFYQDKLDEMERKLQNVRRYSRKKTPPSRPHMRAMKPSTRTDNHVDTLYNPGRSRFLHGY